MADLQIIPTLGSVSVFKYVLMCLIVQFDDALKKPWPRASKVSTLDLKKAEDLNAEDRGVTESLVIVTKRIGTLVSSGRGYLKTWFIGGTIYWEGEKIGIYLKNLNTFS